MRNILRLLVLVVTMLVVRPANAADVPDRAVLLALAAKFPRASTFDIGHVVDDILAAKPTGTEARVMLAWGYFESLWGTYNLGDCTCWKAGVRTRCPNLADRTVANCTSFGVMQTKKPGQYVPGADPAKVAADRRLGFRVGLEVFRAWMKASGGNVRGALRGFSSGHIDRAYEKVSSRCVWVGC